MNLRRTAWAVALVLSACRDPEPTCTEGQTLCAGACVETADDSANCGACGTACGSAEHCRSGACVSGCVVGARFVAAGTVEGCLICDPARSSTALSPHINGTTCATGVCNAGACASGCFINGVFVADASLNPANPCQRCEALTSTSAWTELGNGAGCGNGQVCNAGACGAGCFIDGAPRATGEVNPANACLHCAPGTSTTAWSPRVDGEACGAGQVCGGGACSTQCFISGALVADTGANPANACELCMPTTSTTAWTARADGLACGTGRVCAAGVCTNGCFIDGGVFAEGASNPSDGCQACASSTSTTTWSPRADGETCGAGQVCVNAGCVTGCFIDGGVFDAGVANPSNRCETCVPTTSTAAFTPRALAPLLLPRASLAAQGWSGTSVQPATYLDDGGVITLSTRTNSGANSGGQQLLYTTIGGAGISYTLRTELRVESVGGHNQADSAAAIMGAFTPTFGLPDQRAQMIYLDPNAVGWADDAQTSPFNNLDGNFHVYELSVDGGAATFSVDGVPRLTRTGFTTNGTIAIGDQTNDPNVDSTLHVRSVSLVCP